jgi:hypothetical protein
MHGPINVKSPDNTSKWQMGFNSELKGLTSVTATKSITRITTEYANITSFSVQNEPVTSLALTDLFRFRLSPLPSGHIDRLSPSGL